MLRGSFGSNIQNKDYKSMEKIVIIGNMGYVGSVLVQRIRKALPELQLVGVDSGYFADCLVQQSYPEKNLDIQYYADVRKSDFSCLKNASSVIYLAAISNDPMGERYHKPTFQINRDSALAWAEAAKNHGVQNFVFASSCSVYGSQDQNPRNEDSELSPLTAYSKSKVDAEQSLSCLANTNFQVTCFRFATACGMSPRMRLDLVLNDFVASAISCKRIEIKSDGSPWRPLIHVNDMADLLIWAVSRKNGKPFLVLNGGRSSFNHQVRSLAENVAKHLPGTAIDISPNAQPDKRSYQVDFSKLNQHVEPEFLPKLSLDDCVEDLIGGLSNTNLNEFRNSPLYIRIKKLNQLQENNQLDENLYWKKNIDIT